MRAMDIKINRPRVRKPVLMLTRLRVRDGVRLVKRVRRVRIRVRIDIYIYVLRLRLRRMTLLCLLSDIVFLRYRNI